jgi:hypothetical protein
VASFFLIQADPGFARAVAGILATLPDVMEVSMTSGPYDVVAEVSTVPEQQQRIREAVRRTPGLSRLCVCQGADRDSRMMP